MPDTHKYNASNKPDTCLWCGKKLQHNMRYDMSQSLYTNYPIGRDIRGGYDDQGYFCTMRCAAAFGGAFAQSGYRLPKK